MSRSVIVLHREVGQASLLVVLSLGIFLLGGVGLAIDGSHMYAQRQMAQAAADAAAEAAMLSIYNGSNAITGSTHYFAGTAGTSINPCGTSAATPCFYAGTYNGFNTASDTVKVDFGSNSSSWAPSGIALSTDPTNLVRVTVTRQVDTTFIRFLGPSTSTIKAQAIAAILSQISPIPMVLTHPHLAGSFAVNGTPNVTITGGPQRAIQVDSDGTVANTSISPNFSPPDSYQTRGGSSRVDLSGAGPNSTGADFAILGTPSSLPSTVLVGTTGNWVQPASPFPDPLAGVTNPSPTGFPVNPAVTAVAVGTDGCTDSHGCDEYAPGVYNSSGTNDISQSHTIGTGSNKSALFKPGIYYLRGIGLSVGGNGTITYATGVASDSTTGTNWPAGHVMFFLTGATAQGTSATPVSIGTLNLGGGGTITLNGACNGLTTGSLPCTCTGCNYNYADILFFIDRYASGQPTHSLGGTGSMTLIGSVYANSFINSNTSYELLQIGGTGGSSTTITGEIIASTLQLQGSGSIAMNLNSASFTIRQVALVQ
jgi:Flp pilus assembly protein TadG